MLHSIDSDQLRKRLVFRYPDGTYLHGKVFLSLINLGLREGDKDSWLELKNQGSENSMIEERNNEGVGVI